MTPPFSLRINRVIQILLTFLFVLSVSDALFVPLFGVFVRDFVRGATLSTVGFSFAIFAVTKSLLQIPLARAIDNGLNEHDDLTLMVIGGIISTFSVFMLIFVHEVWQLYLFQALFGVGAASIFAAYYAVFSHHTDKGKEAFEWSLFSVGGLTVSVGLGSFLGGMIADAFGFPILFAASGILSLLATVLLLLVYPQLKYKAP